MYGVGINLLTCKRSQHVKVKTKNQIKKKKKLNIWYFRYNIHSPKIEKKKNKNNKELASLRSSL